MAAKGMAAVTRVASKEEGDGKDARGGGMMVLVGHGLCVFFCLCGETTKNIVGPKKEHSFLELLGRLPVSDASSW